MDSQKLSTINSLIGFLEDLSQPRGKKEVIKENLDRVTDQLNKSKTDLSNINDVKELLWKIRSYNHL